jgi:hypothetical protein
MVEFKKNIKNLLIKLLEFIMNDDKNRENDLLNKYLNYNYKNLKFNELKLYLNNIYIIKIGFHHHHLYKKLIDINYQVIKDINKIDVDNYIIVDYYKYQYGNDAIIIKVYTELYKKNNKIKEVSLNVPVNIENNIIEILPLDEKDTSVI